MTRGRPSLKICGTARPDDARLLDAAEIDYCGIVVDAAFSPRSDDGHTFVHRFLPVPASQGFPHCSPGSGFCPAPDTRHRAVLISSVAVIAC